MCKHLTHCQPRAQIQVILRFMITTVPSILGITTIPVINNDDLPIAVPEGVRAGNRHPISNLSLMILYPLLVVPLFLHYPLVCSSRFDRKHLNS